MLTQCALGGQEYCNVYYCLSHGPVMTAAIGGPIFRLSASPDVPASRSAGTGGQTSRSLRFSWEVKMLSTTEVYNA